MTYITPGGSGDAGDQYTGLDRFGRIVDQKWQLNTTPNPTLTDEFKYGYDRDGNRLYRANVVNTAFSELYHANGTSNGYDSLNQLTAFARGTLNGTNDTITTPAHYQTWTVDGLGNFTAVNTDGTNQTNTYNTQNEITTTGTTYDANGNLTGDGSGKTFSYDAWNRLIKVQQGQTTLATYQYDGLTRRVAENTGTATDVYFSSGWQVVEERVANQARVQYVWSPLGSDTLVERDRDPTGGGTLSERLYAQQDANGDVTVLLTSSGAVAERYVYDPYGAVTVLNAGWSVIAGSAYAWAYLHQGGRYDSTRGLYSFRNRDLSPTLGRWIEVDPIGFGAHDSNLYRYVNNRPVDATDPQGTQVKPEDVKEVAPLLPFAGLLLNPWVVGTVAVVGVAAEAGVVGYLLYDAYKWWRVEIDRGKDIDQDWRRLEQDRKKCKRSLIGCLQGVQDQLEACVREKVAQGVDINLATLQCMQEVNYVERARQCHEQYEQCLKTAVSIRVPLAVNTRA
jgi:RHS repeat-associated protein